MNRTIKFRVWDVDNKIFCHKFNFGTVYNGQDFYDFVDKNKYIIQQFTGILDKNKKEIFEGDILEVDHGDNQGIGKVEYDYCSFLITNKYGCAFIDTYFAMKFSEVIGNIFENPELLS